MTIRYHAALSGCAVAYAIGSALGVARATAAPSDYIFEPIRAEVKNAAGTDIAVRLTHKPTGKPVAGAIVFRARLDMSPDNMADMQAKVEATPSKEPGVYHFKAGFDMAGRWSLKIMAKVPGETETIEGSVVFTAKE